MEATTGPSSRYFKVQKRTPWGLIVYDTGFILPLTVPLIDYRAVYPDVSGPLFGSWDLWRLDIDTELVVTLNQLVAIKKSASASAIPAHVRVALIKVSLYAF